MSQTRTGIALATAAAALFAIGATATVAQAADMPAVKCAGTNSCKGQGSCKSAKNDCKGHNGCKGQGWVSQPSEKACMDAGGKVVK